MGEWKLGRWKTLNIEGFHLQSFLNLCSARAIGFRSIRILDECTMTGEIAMEDLDDILQM